MDEEKKETLSIEEMKNAVSMATFLPDLLRIIQETNNKVSNLNDTLNKQNNALINHSRTISECFTRLEQEIKTLKENQPNYKKDFEKINREIENVKKTINKLNDPLSDIAITGVTQISSNGKARNVDLKGSKTFEEALEKAKKEVNKEPKKINKEEYTQKQKNFLSVMKTVLNRFSGQKITLVTKYALKKTYGEEMADMVIDCFNQYGCYNKETSMATILTSGQVMKYTESIKD